jgi:FkbM family methyltransferase
MKIFFDVGANNGSEFIDLAKKNPNIFVYAFEPTPKLCEIIKSKTNHLKNYKLIQKAVSDFEGEAKFHIASGNDGGRNSLLCFSDKSKTEWIGRKDLNITESLNVNVIRLEEFIEENKIKEIEYLHVDTQGSDLKVLFGMGKKISIVKKGIIEAANKKDILYYGQNEKKECVEFLINKGFSIESIFCNDKWCNEVNIKFYKKFKISLL